MHLSNIDLVGLICYKLYIATIKLLSKKKKKLQDSIRQMEGNSDIYNIWSLTNIVLCYSLQQVKQPNAHTDTGSVSTTSVLPIFSSCKHIWIWG